MIFFWQRRMKIALTVPIFLVLCAVTALPAYKADTYQRLRIDTTPKLEKEDREQYQAFGVAMLQP